MKTFSYPNSDHAAEPASQVVDPQAAATVAQPTPAPKSFSYAETNKPELQGWPAEELPDGVRTLRDADAARRLHSPQKLYADVIPADDAWPPENKAAAAEWREVLADGEIPPNEARELIGVFQGLNELPSDDKVAAWGTEAMGELRRVYGNEREATEALALAKAMVARDPRVQQFLNASGLGNHPTFVLHAARIARSQRGSGRLK